MHNKHIYWMGLIGCIWLLLMGKADSAESAAPPGRPLFTAVDAPTADAPPFAGRARPVLINQTALFPLPEGPAARQVWLNLFPDVGYTALLERVASNRSGSVTWSGRLAGIPHSDVVLVAHDRILVGLVTSPQGVYEIRYLADQWHQVIQVDQNQYPNDDTDLPLPASAQAPSEPPLARPAGIDDGSWADLLVAYTPQARAAAGGNEAIQAVVELAVAITNLALRNSQIDVQFQLVYSYETSSNEAGNLLTDLTRLVNRTDGYYDEVHAYRDTYHADYVTLLTAADPTYCGMGYLQSTPDNANFESAAFNTVRQACAAGDLTLSHELGHNMGLRHDWYMDAGVTPYPYAHGLASREHLWRTSMAYKDWCTIVGLTCVRLPYYTNPAVLLDGAPMGVPGLTPTNCVAGQSTPDPETCVADGHSVINANADTGARFRISANYWTGAAGSDWFDPANWEIVQGPANRSTGASFTLVQRVPFDIDDVVIPAGLPHYPLIDGADAYARELVIEDGAQLSMSSGVLYVSGARWEEMGSGHFAATGGSVIIAGHGEPQTLISNPASQFADLTFGGSQTVHLMSDLHIAGDLAFGPDSLILAGGHTLAVAGDWSDPWGAFQADASRVILDGTNQFVTGGPDLAFHDLEVRGTATFHGDVAVGGDLIVPLDGAADFGVSTVTVEGQVNSLGALRQQRLAPAGETTEFLHIRNAAGSADKYFGLALTPLGDLGATTVTVQGAFCQVGGITWSYMVRRCYAITPTTVDTSGARFYFRSAELNNNPSPDAWRWDGNAWALLPLAARDLSGVENSYVEVSAITSYTTFSVGNPAPLAIRLSHLSTAAAAGLPLVAILLLVILVAAAVWRRRHWGRATA